MIPTALELAVSVAGVFVAYVIYLRRWARPWSTSFTSARQELAQRIARSAPAVMRQTQVAPADLAVVAAFYTRWVNLPRDDREVHGEALRGVGLDMIRLGDSLRWFRDRRYW